MKHSDFPKSQSSFLKVLPQGFLLRGHSLPALDASIRHACLVRKKFLNNKLVCYSPDGVFSKQGIRCRDCSDDKGCQPRVRLLLHPSDTNLPTPILLELPFSSARNFFHFESHLDQSHIPLYQTPIRLAVLPRGSWGEVIFSIPSDLNSSLP